MIPLVITLLTFYGAHLTPMGQNNLLIGDVGAQYVTFLSYFRHAITNLNFSLYSFSLSLGDNFFPVLSYYLLSPFNLILLLFPASKVPEALSWIVIFKIATIGLTTAYYFQKKYHQYQFNNLIFSTIFSLSGFVALYFYNLMWLDALILLPLVTLGIENIFYRQKTSLYVGTLLLTIITNYYMGYMMCLFSVVYFGYLCLLNRSFNKQTIGKYLIASLISGLLSLFILLPTALSMLQTSKQKLNLNNFLPLPEYGWSSLIQFGVVGNTVAKRISYGPEVFMTSLALILVISFFLNQKISKQRKIAAGYILTILFLGMFILVFNTIWHMFQPPVGLHFRNVYFFSFMAIIFASESFQAGLTKKNLMTSVLLSLGIILLGYYFAVKSSQYVSIKYFYWSVFFIILGGFLVKLSFQKGGFQYLLLLMVCIELQLNFLGGLQGLKFGREDLYQKYYQTEAKTYQQIRSHDSGFYRVVNKSPLINRADYIFDSNNNDPLIFGSNGVSLYSSTLNSNTRQMLLDLGYYGRNIRSVSPNNGTKLTDALFGVKYQIVNQRVLQTNALRLGTVVDEGITKVKLTANNPIANQEKVWLALTHKKQEYFTIPKVEGISISSSVAGNLYFVNQGNATGIMVDGKKIPIDNYEHNNVIDLGNITSDRAVNVQVLGTKVNSQTSFYVLNNQKLKQSIGLLNKQQLQVQGKFPSQSINGKVKITNKKQILFLNIPYDKGWTATVDGKSRPIKRVLGNMSYLKLNPGEHRITLKYHVPGLKLGLIISALALILYLVLLMI